MALKSIKAPTLEIAYYEHGPTTGWPVVLSHGFPYDIHAFDEVCATLAVEGAWVIVPYLRGFGQHDFYPHQPCDQAVVAGFDWGGVASCVAAALWPERVSGLVSYAGYDIIDRAGQQQATQPALECVMWYQHLFQQERGRRCLQDHRRELCRLLWQQWSPTWQWNSAMFDRTALSFDNPDFVDVVIHAYRFVFSTEEGDLALEEYEQVLAARPTISVPSITLDGTQDPLKPEGTGHHDVMFVKRHERREYDAGHAFPMEEPEAFTQAILDVHSWNEQGQ